MWEGKGIKSPEMERITDKEGHKLFKIYFLENLPHTGTHRHTDTNIISFS